MKPIALVTGVTGQDGAYLSQLLLEKGYAVHGLARRSSHAEVHTHRLDWLGITDQVEFHDGDLTDLSSLIRLMRTVKPTEIYNLGAQSFVKASWMQPLLTGQVTAMGLGNMLEAVRLEAPEARFYQASSSEMYGLIQEPMQSETTPFYPRSPYACGKLFAHWQTINYRESYNIFGCNGILFNHESPRRGETFVTRKITRAIARIVAKQQDKLYLGNLESKRDWGYAKDYVVAMWLMLQQDTPDDYVIATGETHAIHEFLTVAFNYVDLNWKDYVEFDSRYLRPAEVELLIGDPTKAQQKLGWKPTVTFTELVHLMVDTDLHALGLKSPNYAGEETLPDVAIVRQALATMHD